LMLGVDQRVFTLTPESVDKWAIYRDFPYFAWQRLIR